MALTVETINILFFLIPGFFASFIMDAIIVRTELNLVKRIIESLVFSFFIYLVTSLFTKIELFASINIKDSNTIFRFCTNPWFLSILLVVSFLIPFVIGTIVHRDLHMAILRKLRITNKTSKDSVWQEAFYKHNGYIVVNFKDDRRMIGWPTYYSDFSKEGEIYLDDTSWIEDNEYTGFDKNGALVKYEDITYIEFIPLESEGKDAN